MARDAKETQEPVHYRDAVREIEEILTRLEDDREVDIDTLADQVERASTLIGLCSERLRSSQLRIRKVADDLARTTAAMESSSADEDRALDGDVDEDEAF